MMIMSSYYKSVHMDTIAQTRYLEKLGCIGLEKKDDPFCNEDKFQDDMTSDLKLNLAVFFITL